MKAGPLFALAAFRSPLYDLVRLFARARAFSRGPREVVKRAHNRILMRGVGGRLGSAGHFSSSRYVGKCDDRIDNPYRGGECDCTARWCSGFDPCAIPTKPRWSCVSAI